jgi:hypothetical protein
MFNMAASDEAGRTASAANPEGDKNGWKACVDSPPTILDQHRGMAAQVATELRRMRAEVEADQSALRERREILEGFLIATPVVGWAEAVEKARYLLSLFAETPAALDPRRQKLMADLLADFERLLGEPSHPDGA